jgi:type II secretory pathway component GspD/PulD (secretin)
VKELFTTKITKDAKKILLLLINCAFRALRGYFFYIGYFYNLLCVPTDNVSSRLQDTPGNATGYFPIPTHPKRFTLKRKLLPLILITLLNNISFAAETIIEVIPVNNRPASEIQPLISPMLENTDRVIADGSNLIVKTTPDRLNEIKKFINNLDSRLNNLIITVIQSKHTTADELNAAARVNLNIPIDDMSKSSGRITGHYYQTDDRNSNESTQTIRTLEGNTAHITVGKTYPIQNVQIYNFGYGYGYPAVSTATEFINATTGFAVTSRLAGQQALLDVSPWSDKANARGQLETQGAQSTIKINLGEWVELGGIDETSQNSTNGNLATIRQTRENRLRILVKVDKAD